MKIKAFTLSEVLITLVIIGVVAALTVPVAFSEWRKQSTISQLKKVYSTLSNVTNLAISEYGPVDSWQVTRGATGAWTYTETYILPFLNVAKNCKLSTDANCEFSYKYLNKTEQSIFGTSYYKFILNDGTFIAVQTINEEKENNETIVKPIYTVDLNGHSGPNIYGRDIYMFELDYLSSGGGLFHISQV